MAEWKPFDLTWGRSIYYCTECKEGIEVPTSCGKPMYKFCPMCGARMDTADTPQTDCEDIYPLAIIEDRYTGVYSNGEYTAWNMYFGDIPREIDEDDVTCRNFWYSYGGIVGLGKTPNEAIEDLRKKLNAERNEK